MFWHWSTTGLHCLGRGWRRTVLCDKYKTAHTRRKPQQDSTRVMGEQWAVTLKLSEGPRQREPAMELMEEEDSVNNTQPLKASWWEKGVIGSEGRSGVALFGGLWVLKFLVWCVNAAFRQAWSLLSPEQEHIYLFSCFFHCDHDAKWRGNFCFQTFDHHDHWRLITLLMFSRPPSAFLFSPQNTVIIIILSS